MFKKFTEQVLNVQENKKDQIFKTDIKKRIIDIIL